MRSPAKLWSGQNIVKQLDILQQMSFRRMEPQADENSGAGKTEAQVGHCAGGLGLARRSGQRAHNLLLGGDDTKCGGGGRGRRRLKLFQYSEYPSQGTFTCTK